jgi:hypothetical protein
MKTTGESSATFENLSIKNTQWWSQSIATEDTWGKNYKHTGKLDNLDCFTIPKKTNKKEKKPKLRKKMSDRPKIELVLHLLIITIKACPVMTNLFVPSMYVF